MTNSKQAQSVAARLVNDAKLRANTLGTGAQVDVLQFTTSAASIADALSRARAERTTRAIELGRLLGMSPSAAQSLQATGEPPALGALPGLDELTQEVDTSSAQLAALRADLERSKARVTVARNADQPRVDLFAKGSVGTLWDISVDTYGDRVFKGLVDRVSPLGVDTSSVVTFDVEIAVTDESAPLLRSGMSADIEIVTTEHKDALLVPLLAVQSKGKQRFVRSPDGAERPIHVGATDGTQMVVLDGLQEGDSVLASAPVSAPAAAPNNNSNRAPIPGMGMGGGRRGR